MAKNNEKRQKFIQNNRKIANSIGNIFAILFALAIFGRLIYSVIQFFLKFIPEVISSENFKFGLFVIGFVFVAYIIASFLFGGGLEDD